LLSLAKKRGYAIGIGHPYPETMDVLRKELANIESLGIRLIPVSQIVEMQKGDNRSREPLYDSPAVVKK